MLQARRVTTTHRASMYPTHLIPYLLAHPYSDFPDGGLGVTNVAPFLDYVN